MIRRLWQELNGPTTVDHWTLASQAILIGIIARAWHRTGSVGWSVVYIVMANFFLARWLRDFKTWLLDVFPDDDSDDGDDEEEAETRAPAAPPAKEEIRCH